MLAKRKEVEEQQKLRSEMDRVLNEGGNPIEGALWKIKLEKIEKDKESAVTRNIINILHCIFTLGI